MSGATVTPSGVRDGDPAALAGLCAVRGPSVVAYCRHVAGEADAGAAAADAFARFRVAVVAAGDTTSLNPEALLVSAARTSAAARASTSGQEGCVDVPMLLAQRAEKTITAADLERLESHLEQCSACRVPVARFKAAERAYRDPPEKTVDDALTAQIVAALSAAVPSPPPPASAPPSPNGSPAATLEEEVAPVAEAAPAPAPPPDQATADFAAPGTVEPVPAEADPGAEAAAKARRRRRREKKSSGGGAGAFVPPQGAPRKRSALRLAVVLPIVLILLALLAALYVSGVFGGDEPASTPSVSVPTAQPGPGALDRVPDAKDASADAVETAKARARGDDAPSPAAKRKEKAEAASAPTPAAPPPVATSPPPAAPAVRANTPAAPPPPPPPPPAPRRDTAAGDEKQIDAGSGATGAEQIPPAADASDVPDLAPPETITP